MPGGANGITIAPGIAIIGPRTRPSTACSEWLFPLRSS